MYVALNTILTDAELPRAEDLARKLCEIGVDALIVQDMGLACRLARFLPMPLHASTQCDIRSPEKAEFFDSLGFETIVLARELSLSQIGEISRKVKARIECFRPRCALRFIQRMLLPQLCDRRAERKPRRVRPALQNEV